MQAHAQATKTKPFRYLFNNFFLSQVYKQQLELFFPLFIISLHDKMRRRKNNMSKNIISEMWLTAVDYDAR